MRTTSIGEMKEYIKKNNLTHLVRELVGGDVEPEGAIEYVYDSHTLGKEQFIEKYFG